MPINTKELIEKLATIEHERWADWQRYVHNTYQKFSFGQGEYRLFIANDLYDRWNRQINTPYSELSEQEKQSDRDQVMRYWPLIQDMLSAYTEGVREGIENLRIEATRGDDEEAFMIAARIQDIFEEHVKPKLLALLQETN